eukprot:5446656-Prymnesium_polylepis.1
MRTTDEICCGARPDDESTTCRMTSASSSSSRVARKDVTSCRRRVGRSQGERATVCGQGNCLWPVRGQGNRPCWVESRGGAPLSAVSG